MLSVSDLHTFYGDSHVLQGVSLGVEPASVTAVLGRNGVGKTTLCGSLVGFNPPRAGRVVFAGVDITGLAPHRICALGLGLVPQGRRIFSSLTVAEHLRIAARRGHGAAVGETSQGRGGWSEARVFDLFPRLRERAAHRGGALSGGEQQMLAIARALMANPRLLVMDEPTEGLAPALVAEVARLIGRLRAEGTTVLLVEQNAAFAVKVADYVHVMSKGAIVHASEPGVLWENQEVRTQLLGVPG
jgi:branched-chain amino acid transport system ATP-binding protein